MSQILIVGGAGYIGSHTAHQLHRQGYKVVVIDNLSTGDKTAVPDGAEFLHVDILDTEALRAALKGRAIDAVFHFAAKLSVPESFLKFDEYFKTNVVGTFNILQVCRELHVQKFIFSSTAAVYGESTTEPITEAAPQVPSSPYGQTKKMTEELIQSFATTVPGFRYHILRYFNVAGAEIDGSNGPRNKKSGQLMMNMCVSALGSRELRLFGTDFNTPDGTAVRDYIHVVDLAAAHIEAYRCLTGGAPSSIWNCGYGQGYSVAQMIHAFEKASGVTFEVTKSPARTGDPASVVADNSRIMRESAWRPQHNDIAKICKTMYDWVKNAR